MVTFHESAATPAYRQALAFLRGQTAVAGFYLAGGTALALQIGHRISADLDWFTANRLLLEPEREALRQALALSGDFEVKSEQDGMMFTRLLGTDVSFIYQHQYQHQPLMTPTVDFEGIPLASPTDIGLMKLVAINSRGTRRDFIDLQCLRQHVNLDRLLELAAIKYADRSSFLPIAVRALACFDDAEDQPMPMMLHPVRWQNVCAYCEGVAKRLARRASGLT